MEDVGGAPPPPSSIAIQDSSSINELDGWIATLMQCKQLNELDVQRLCDKVLFTLLRPITSTTRSRSPSFPPFPPFLPPPPARVGLKLSDATDLCFRAGSLLRNGAGWNGIGWNEMDGWMDG